MRSFFLLILGLCAGRLQKPVLYEDCFEKDHAPVDFVYYNYNCIDLEGNIFSLGSELQSCCGCFRYKCQKVNIWENEQSDGLKVSWVKSVSAECCQTCNGTVFPANTVISTTQLEDDCLTTQTEVCRVRPGLDTAVIELEFSYRNCCNDNNNFVIVTGGLPYSESQKVTKYFADGTSQALPNLLIPRRDHSCGSYIYDGKEILIVVAGETMPTPTSSVQTNTVETYDLTTPGSTWVSTTNFPFLVSGSRGVTLHNIFYVTGGQFGIWNWNPDPASWTFVAQLCSRGRIFHGASVVPITDDLLQHCKSCFLLEDDKQDEEIGFYNVTISADSLEEANKQAGQ